MLYKLFHQNLFSLTLIAFLIFFSYQNVAVSQSLPSFHFTEASVAREWKPIHDIAEVRATPEGMLIEFSGSDPYLQGPARNYPSGLPLWLNIRIKSDQVGLGQIFFSTATKGNNEEDSVRFSVLKTGVWVKVRVPVPALGPETLLRIDPPGSTSGKVVIASLNFEPRVKLKEPQWPTPTAPQLDAPSNGVQSGDLSLIHDKKKLGSFRIQVAKKDMAVGFNRPLIGYMQAGQQRWLNLEKKAKIMTVTKDNTLIVRAIATDGGGARWGIEQQFTEAKLPGAIDVVTTVTVNQSRNVSFLPMLVILPGVGSFGAEKDHGLFAGLEYLDKPDVSSSEADIIGPGSKRQFPNIDRITFPLMAIQAEDRYIGLIWDKRPEFSAVFDSPDRLFKSGGHVMGVIFPGSDGIRREEGSILPNSFTTLSAKKPLILHATIIGGRGQSVVPAVQQYVALRGLPNVLPLGMNKQGYISLAAGGWLDSKIRVGNEFRPVASEKPFPAVDAPVFIEWLAHKTEDMALRTRLHNQAKATIAEVSPADYNTAGLTHALYPAPTLIYGHVAENADRAGQSGRSALSRFEPDGRLLYQPEAKRQGLGKTHFAPDANGLTARVVGDLLKDAIFSGDEKLIREGLRLLRALDKFHDSAPRGAQTHEIPLHTPDILASANLVRAYTLGYELTGDQHFLTEAIYWAWTGVPFVYLTKPTSQPVGSYATTGVFGATFWHTPNWMGLPVQWCGLVYSDALYRLLQHDPKGPWKQIADGITTSGIQQSWPHTEKDLQGLLPDYYHLETQMRDGVAINPGTLQANAIHLLGGPEIYDFHVFRKNGLIVHAPGTISDVQEKLGQVSFTVKGDWLEDPYNILVTGFKAQPQARANGKEVQGQYREEKRHLILRANKNTRIDISVK